MTSAEPRSHQAAAGEIAEAVAAWLAGLHPDQRATAVFSFSSPERSTWRFVPGTRTGLSFADMLAPQRDAARRIVRAAMSDRGAREIARIIDLEVTLGELERAADRLHHQRDPERYWFAVYGEPGEPAPWAWRVEGHHISIRQTLADGRVLSSTPSFLGANPATVPSGPSAGARALDGEERLARTLLATLSPAQRSVAIVDPVAPPEILSGTGARADLDEVPTGIRAAELDGPQQQDLERLIRHYIDRVRPEVADVEWRRIVDAGFDDVTFAWAGPADVGGHYYAVRGPNFLIEYDNTQNGANHIHALWRDGTNDWGEDILAAHYRTGHATT